MQQELAGAEIGFWNFDVTPKKFNGSPLKTENGWIFRG